MAAGEAQLAAQLVLGASAHGEALGVGARGLGPRRCRGRRAARGAAATSSASIASTRRKQRVGRRHRPAGGARGLVVLERLARVAQQPRAPGLALLDDDQRVSGQEVEAGSRGRAGAAASSASAPGGARAAQQRVDPAVDLPGGDALRLGEGAQRGHALDDEVAVEEQLARRRRHHARERRLGALARGIELAERLDLVAEQLDPHRPRALGREEVDDAAAHRELAALLDERLARVAGEGEGRDQRVALEALRRRSTRSARARTASRAGTRSARAVQGATTIGAGPSSPSSR